MICTDPQSTIMHRPLLLLRLPDSLFTPEFRRFRVAELGEPDEEEEEDGSLMQRRPLTKIKAAEFLNIQVSFST